LAVVREAVTRWMSAVVDARGAAAAAARRVPSPEVLRTLLPSRLAAVRTRAASAVVRERHAAFLNECADYRHAVSLAAADDPSLFSVTLGGVQWWVPVSDRQPDRAERVEAQDLPFRAVLQTREVSVGPVMIDIGANIGRTSVLRVVLGDVGVCWAAEPDPDNYRSLVRTVVTNALAGLVFPEHCAIGDIDGEILLHRSKYIGGHAVRPDADAAGSVRVPCRRLDSWMAARRVDLDAVSFVKVDVQGWETRVLQGAPAVLAQRHIAWQLEVDPQQLAAAGSSLQDLLTSVQSHFAYFIDMHAEAVGPRMRPVADLTGALGYLADGRSHKTDLILIRE
jgi:FkbM family methyltransferase